MDKVKKILLLLPAPKPTLVKTLISWVPTTILAVLLALLLLQLLWFRSSLDKALQRAQRWPQLPSSHFYLAKALWKTGQETLAQKEFRLGEAQTKNFKKIMMGWLWQYDWEKTKNILEQKQKTEHELNQLNQLLSNYPYSWQLLLSKAVLAYQLYQDQTAQEALNLANWLIPENQEVVKIRDLIGKKN